MLLLAMRSTTLAYLSLSLPITPRPPSSLVSTRRWLRSKIFMAPASDALLFRQRSRLKHRPLRLGPKALFLCNRRRNLLSSVFKHSGNIFSGKRRTTRPKFLLLVVYCLIGIDCFLFCLRKIYVGRELEHILSYLLQLCSSWPRTQMVHEGWSVRHHTLECELCLCPRNSY